MIKVFYFNIKHYSKHFISKVLILNPSQAVIFHAILARENGPFWAYTALARFQSYRGIYVYECKILLKRNFYTQKYLQPKV